MDIWPFNFELAFAGKAIVAKTTPVSQKKAVTTKKAESSSDSDSGNSRHSFGVFVLMVLLARLLYSGVPTKICSIEAQKLHSLHI